MTGMWPSGAQEQHHVSHAQHMQPVGYGNAYQASTQLDVYGHAAAAAAAAGFDGWAVAQAAAHAQQYGVNGGPGASQHMLPAHMAGHMGHPMMASMGGPHHGMSHQAANSNGNRSTMMMPPWVNPGQHLALPGMMPPPGSNHGSPPHAGYVAGGPPGTNGSRGWAMGQKTAGAGGYGGISNGRQPGGRQQPGRGGRPRRHIVLNTNPGDFSDAAVEEFAAAVKRTPAGEALDHKMLSSGLQNLDSRGLAALLKELAKGHHGKRVREVFDFLRVLPSDHHLAPLCDVFTYTAMVSLCVDNQELSRAFELVTEMKQRNVECNVHTYTALMNVAIKSGQLQKALEVYHEMLREGCTPNVVTYNTLIDVYGKTGQWGEALRVIETMNASNTKPVTRTYNTLMIACNTSGQWQESLNVYNDMVRRGHQPNTTTYNALISAYSKAGRLEKVMEVYQEMLRNGCERSVITYSALISACEKAGQWQLALNLFTEMLRERCTPNVITYNSLITACAQGAQWAKAAEVFEQMQTNNCRPDVVTYTALVTAYERGGQWIKALEAFQQMQQQQGCNADAILYNTLLDVLWDTGIPWAQHQAAQLFRVAVDEGHFRKLPLPQQQQPQQQRVQQQQQQQTEIGSPAGLTPAAAVAAGSSADLAGATDASSSSGSPTAAAAGSAAASTKLELGMQGVSPGVAMLMLHCWLADLRSYVVQQQQQATSLPDRIMVSAGRSRQRDHISGLLRDSTLALLTSWRSPFTVVSSTEGNGNNNSNNNSSSSSSNSKLEAPGPQVAEWLMQEHMQQLLSGFARQPGISAAAMRRKSSGVAGGKAITLDLSAELSLDKRCQEAFAAVKEFETKHCLSVQSMGVAYTAAHSGLVSMVLEVQGKLGVRNDLVHDAILLMDRAMSASFKVNEDAFSGLAAACLHHVIHGASDLPSPAPSLVDICAAVGWGNPEEAESMLKEVKVTLKDDLSSISALRCLKLYLERLGCVFATDGSCSSQDSTQDCFDLVARAVSDSEFLNYRPTITAAAVLYCERLHKGKLPFWPSSLSGLTSYSNARTPELSAAIGGAQRLWKQLASARQKAVEGVAAAATGEPADGAAGAAAAEAGAAQQQETAADGSAQQAPSSAPAATAAAPAAAAAQESAVEQATAQMSATKV